MKNKEIGGEQIVKNVKKFFIVIGNSASEIFLTLIQGIFEPKKMILEVEGKTLEEIRDEMKMNAPNIKNILPETDECGVAIK